MSTDTGRSRGKMQIKIIIDAEVEFLLDHAGTEVTAVTAGAHVEDGLIALEPPIAMHDAGLAVLKDVLIDATMAQVAKETRKKLAVRGLSPIIEIINEPLKGPIH